MTTLYANGCSMTYGTGLFDEPGTRDCLDHDRRMQEAWPGRLGALLGAERIVNDAVPGGSNDRIVRRTTEWVLDALAAGTAPSDLLVVIGWSAPMRREFHVDGVWRQLIPYHDYRDPDVNLLNSVYRDVAWDDGEGATRFALQVVLLQRLLGSLGVPYLFFDALPASETLRNATESTATITAIETGCYLGFRADAGDMGSQLKQLEPEWQGVHPSGEGHERWAKLLADEVASRWPVGRGDVAPAYEGTRDFTIIDVKTGRAPGAPGRAPAEPKRSTARRIADAFRRQPFIYD